MKFFAEPRFGTMAIVGALSMTIGLCVVDRPALAQDGQADQTAVAQGEAALAEGREALEAGRWTVAVDKFNEALRYLPGNEEAIRGRDQALAMLNQGNTIADVAEDLRLNAERTRVEFADSMSRAQQSLAEGNYSAANQEVLKARLKLDERRQYLDEVEFNRMRDQAEALMVQIEEQRTRAELEQQRIAQQEAERAKEEARRRELAERQRQIDENLRRVRQLQMELKYDEALQVVDEILFLDEHNPSALILRDALTTAKLYRSYVEIQQLKELGLSEISLQAQRATVLPRPNLTGPGDKSTTGLVAYPEDWPQLSLRRGGEGGYQEAPEDREVLARLEETRIPVDFSNHTFDQVITFLKQVTGLNIYVDYNALNNVGITQDDEITLSLQNATVATILERVLDQLGEGDDRPQYVVQDGILTISSDEALRQRTVLLVYDIRDLLFQVPIFDNAPTLDLDTALNQGQNQGGQGGGGGGGGGGFGGGGGGSGQGGSIFGGGAGDEPDRLTREELVEQIVNIIQENVDPDGWRDLGGDTGSLQELNGNLIITNTPNNHRAIHSLLAQLRDIRALQINVESRFLTVSSDWFEKIGVDLDLYFNVNDDVWRLAREADPNAHLSDFFDNTGRLKDPVIYGNPAQVLDPELPHNTIPTGKFLGIPNGTFANGFENIDHIVGPVGAPIRTQQGFAPIGVTQRHNTLIDDLADFGATSFAGIASSNPALTVGIQFLDDIQVDLLIEATQADKRSVILTAPRLTFFNGQRAWVAVTTQQAFVSGLTAVTGDASGAFQPTIARLADGFVLDVEGVISADRRYVTMTVIFDFAEFLGFRQSSAAEFQGSTGSTGSIGGGDPLVFQGLVELPVLRVSQIRTTVSVPDKGTVLLGGQRHVEEVDVETGVPVLSKIPFINRFFTNRVTSKNEQTLLILIRPEIIIQQENEDLLFPGLSDSLGSSGSYLR